MKHIQYILLAMLLLVIGAMFLLKQTSGSSSDDKNTLKKDSLNNVYIHYNEAGNAASKQNFSATDTIRGWNKESVDSVFSSK